LATSSFCTFWSSVEYGHGSAADAADAPMVAASAAPTAADWRRCCAERSIAGRVARSLRRSDGPTAAPGAYAADWIASAALRASIVRALSLER
jgi:hypothetical protein